MERQRVAESTAQIHPQQKENNYEQNLVYHRRRQRHRNRNCQGNVAQEKIAFVQLDVANEAQAKAAVDEATKRFGRIDVLVNNAGYSLLGNFEQMTTAEIQQQFATNFYGVAHLMHVVLPVMRRQRSGHIINISSVAGVV